MNEQQKTIDRTIRIPTEDYEIIKTKAKLSHKTINSYLIESAKNSCILKFDYEEIREHTNQVKELKNAVNRILATVIETREIYDSDIQTITDLLKKLTDNENTFLATMRKDREKKDKYLYQKVNKLFSPFQQKCKFSKNNIRE